MFVSLRMKIPAPIRWLRGENEISRVIIRVTGNNEEGGLIKSLGNFVEGIPDESAVLLSIFPRAILYQSDFALFSRRTFAAKLSTRIFRGFFFFAFRRGNKI